MATQMLRGTPVQYELKRVNRFQLEFPTELNIESWLVQMVKRPTIEINGVEIPYLNTSFYVAGRYKWSSFDLEFIDPIGPSTSGKVMEWVRLHAESLSGRMGYANLYKKSLMLKAIDPTGNEVEKWVMYDTMITNVDFGNNDHGDDALQKVKVTLQPDFCELSY